MKRQRGFTLMETMVVLTIVAILAAASAPMMNKKMLRDSAAAAGDSPWRWTNGAGTSAMFNFDGNDNVSAIIGRNSVPLSSNNPRLYIDTATDTNAHITFSTNGGNKVSLFAGGANNLCLSNNTPRKASNTIAIGYRIDVNGTSDTNTSAIAIGNGSFWTKARSENSIAIGNGANAGTSNGLDAGVGPNSMAIGARASGESENSIAIGAYTWSGSANSIAIGCYARCKHFSQNSIAIGNNSVVFNETYDAIAIGNKATVEPSNNSIALGNGATVEPSNNSIALGNGATVKVNTSNAIALGNGATIQMGAKNSVAIGPGAVSNSSNEIVLGTADSVVHIPGKLVVDSDALFKHYVFLYPITKSGSANPKEEAKMLEELAYLVGGNRGKLYEKLWSQENMKDASELGSELDWTKSYTSDRRLKNVGKTFKGGLAEIKKLEVFNYTFKNDEDKTPHVGIMAQDLKKVFPDAVTKGEDGFLRIRREDMFYALINAVKELDSRTVALEQKQKRIDELEKRVEKLEKRLEKLEKGQK